MRKILITGGTGFLGKHLVEFYENNPQYKVYFCSKSTGIDLRIYQQIYDYLEDIKPDVIIHCAAHVGGIQYDKMYPIEVLEDNILISKNIIKAVAESGVKTLIDIMPNCTYPAKYNIYEEKNWWNGEMHPSVLVYGFSRKTLYVYSFAYLEKFNFKVAHLILPNLYGPGDHFDPIKSHALGALIFKIVEAKKNNVETVEIWGTGKPIREWLYVTDAVLAINEVLLNIEKIPNNDILNIGTGVGISILDLANEIKKIVGWDGKFILNTNMQDGAMEKRLSNKKMKNYINWQPLYSFEEGLIKTINSYIENIHL